MFPPPWPWTFNFKWTPPLQIITNQLQGNTILGWLLYVIRSFLQADFHFQYQLINLAWLSIDFFRFSWNQSCPQSNIKKLKTSSSPSSYSEKCAGVKVELKPHYLRFHGFTLLCVQLSKNIMKYFLKKRFF